MNARSPSWRKIGAISMIVLFGLACAPTVDGPADDDPEAMGFRHLEAGRVDEGLECFRRAMRENRASHRVLIGMALAYARRHDTELFESFALEASHASPKDTPSYARLGMMYVAAAEMNSEHPAAIYYARLGVDYLRRVFVADADTPDLFFHLGLGLLHTRDPRGAQLFLEQAHAKEPERDDVLRGLVRALEAAGDRRRLADVLAARCRKSPLPPDLESLRATTEGNAPNVETRPVGPQSPR